MNLSPSQLAQLAAGRGEGRQTSDFRVLQGEARGEDDWEEGQAEDETSAEGQPELVNFRG